MGWRDANGFPAGSFHFLAAFEHRGSEEGVADLVAARKPAAGAEHRRHRTLVDPQVFALRDMLLARQIGGELALETTGPAGTTFCLKSPPPA